MPLFVPFGFSFDFWGSTFFLELKIFPEMKMNFMKKFGIKTDLQVEYSLLQKIETLEVLYWSEFLND